MATVLPLLHQVGKHVTHASNIACYKYFCDNCVPQAPTMPGQVTLMPSLASTPWTWSLQLVRMCTSLQRYLVISGSSRISGGATPRSASRPIRSRRARSRVSSSSFLTGGRRRPSHPAGAPGAPPRRPPPACPPTGTSRSRPPAPPGGAGPPWRSPPPAAPGYW